MTVFVLMNYDVEADTFYGVYSTLEKAKASVPGEWSISTEKTNATFGNWSLEVEAECNHYYIKEVQVDA